MIFNIFAFLSEFILRIFESIYNPIILSIRNNLISNYNITSPFYVELFPRTHKLIEFSRLIVTIVTNFFAQY